MQVTKAGGWYAQESFDGQTLYYEKADAASSEVWSVSANGGPETPLIAGVGTRAWTPVNNGIYFFDAAFNGVAGQTGNLRFFSFPTQKARLVGRAGKPVISGITVSPDGRSLLFSQVDNNGSNLMLAEKAR